MFYLENIQIISNQDGLVLDVLISPAEGDLKGVVQISHGMAEHKERYIPFMSFLSKNGYASIIHDHRGHGKSVKSPDDLGYFYEKKANMIVEDLYQVGSLAKERFGNVPFILFGHSMGSMVVRKFLKKYDFAIDKLIVCGSPSKNPFARLGLFVTKVLEIFHGDHYRSNFVQNLAFGGYDKKVGEKAAANSWICSDPQVVADYQANALCGFTFTLNGFQNLFHLMLDIYSPNGWGKKNLGLPILFIAGSDDPVIASKRKWLQSQEFLKRLGYKNIHQIYYQGLRHELLNETIASTIYQDILTWVEPSK